MASESEIVDSHTKEILEVLAGKPPTAAQENAAKALKEKFGFSDGDPVWCFLLVMGYYDRVLSEIPAKLEQSAMAAVSIFKAAADLQHTERQSQFVRMQAGGQSAQSAVTVMSWRSRFFAAGAAILATVSLLGAGYVVGERSGLAGVRGETAWLQTPPGKAAFAFQQLNDVPAMMRCDKFERVQDGKRVWCRPQDQGRVYGWRIE